MTSWFRRVLKSKCPRRSCRPSLEALEDRTLLNNRFVVPIGVPVDNATSFGTLQMGLRARRRHPHQHNFPASFQLVSSTCVTATSRTTGTATGVGAGVPFFGHKELLPC
jgi:hypothetical protein